MTRRAQRWLFLGAGALFSFTACAGSKTRSDDPETASTAHATVAAKPAFFGPDKTLTASHADAGSDAAPDHADPGKVLPTPPSCEAVATTAPLSIDGDSLIDSPKDPRLISLRQSIKRLDPRVLQCRPGHNDGRLFNWECESKYLTGDGYSRPGGVESHLFEWNGQRFEPVPFKNLFPGGKGFGNVMRVTCNTDQLDYYRKIWLDHSGLSFIDSISPTDRSSCRIEYAERADWVGCGPLAYLAGYAARAPAPAKARPEPLGWDSERLMSRLPEQGPLVQRINSRIDAFYKQPKPDVRLECTQVFSNSQVISLQCSEDYNTKLRLNYSVRTGAEFDVDTLIAVAGPKLISAATTACNKQYHKHPKSEYELFSKSPIKLARDDLTAFEFHSSYLRFHMEIELQMLNDSPTRREATCDVPWKSAGLSSEKLGAVPATTP